MSHGKGWVLALQRHQTSQSGSMKRPLEEICVVKNFRRNSLHKKPAGDPSNILTLVKYLILNNILRNAKNGILFAYVILSIF